ncbi:MAG: ferritin-like domain-containing protein [Sphingomonadales bacterium]|jgi:rubrerythrin
MRWTLDDIRWTEFDASKVDADLLRVIKTAALVEANSADYVTYLKNVFPGDEEFATAAEQWGLEEAQHGAALARWAEMADPDFSFEDSLRIFREGYSLPLETTESVRGSQAGELVARCVVECGTSSFYTAIRDAVEEPVLKQIAHRIAADEFAHYQLFHKYIDSHGGASLGRLARLKVAVTRVQEAEDDELAYAYYAANVKPKDANAVFDGKLYAHLYNGPAFGLYKERHIENATRMIMRAANINPQGKVASLAAKAFWKVIQYKRRQWAKAA